MLCPQCRQDNPSTNRFCGMCGSRLQAADSAAEPRSSPALSSSRQDERVEAWQREAAARAERERAAHEREVAERAQRAAIRERELAAQAEAERAAQEREAAQKAERERAAREREALDRAVRMRAPASAPPESRATTTSVGGPSFLGLSASDDTQPIHYEDAEYGPNDLYGGGRSYKRAIWLLIILLVVAGLGFLQWRYSHSLQASQSPQKPSAAEPSESKPANAEAQREAEMAQNSEVQNAAPQSDESAPPTSERKKAESQKTNKTDESTKPKQETPAAEQESQQDNEKPAEAEKDEQTAPKQEAKPSARSTAREQAPEESDQPVRLAESYLVGRGVPQSCDRGLSILREAANRGNYRAQIKLGALYATGNCVSLDRVQAYRFFTRALQSKPNNAWVEQNRSMLWAQMDDQERRLAMQHNF